MKTQEKFESYYLFPEIPCTRSNYLDSRIFRYSDIYSDIYNIYSPPKFSGTCSASVHINSRFDYFLFRYTAHSMLSCRWVCSVLGQPGSGRGKKIFAHRSTSEQSEVLFSNFDVDNYIYTGLSTNPVFLQTPLRAIKRG